MKKRISLAALALSPALVLGQENYAQWSGSKTYLMNTSASGAAITENLVNFPVLIRLGEGDSALFAQSLPQGQDIRFTKMNGTRLHHQIERWDSAQGLAEIWVKLDTVYGNASTQSLRMYWGKSDAADSSNGAAVFDTATGFQAVYHMTGDGSTTSNGPDESDATANGFTADNRNTVDVQNPAAVGRGRDFNGSNEHFRILAGPSGAMDLPAAPSGRYTVSAWASTNSTGATNRTIVAKNDRSMALQINGSSRWEFFEYNNRRATVGGNPAAPWGWQSATATTPISPGWNHIVGVSDGAVKRLYVNGVLVSTNPGTDSTNFAGANATAAVTTDSMTIGRQAEASGGRYWQGDLDEVRLATAARSADWIKLEYENQKEGSAFIAPLAAPTLAYAQDSVTWYEDYATSVAPLVPMTSGVPGPTYSVSPALPAGVTLNASTGVISGSPTQNVDNTYVITATNSQGTASDTIKIFVHNNENFNGWSGTRTVMVDGPGIGLTGTVSRYPLLVRLTSADSAVFSGVGPGAASLRFTNGAGAPLHHQVDTWDSAARSAAVWVLMDSVRASGPTTLNIRYGNATAVSRSDGGAVFDRGSGFMGVYHMGTASGGVPRPNAVNPGMNDATPVSGDLAGGFVPRPGIIGMADTLRRIDDTQPNDDHFDLDTGFADFNGQVTMSMWVKPVVGSGQTWTQYLSVSTGPSSNNIWFGRVNTTNDLGFEVYNGGAGGTRHDAAGAISQGEWQLFTVTMNGLEKRIYKNGELVGGPFTSGQPIPNVTRTQNHIGRAPWPDENLHGMVDEVRIANQARSADWVRLDYAAQRPGAAPLAGLSYPTVSGQPGAAITPVSPVLASGSALSWSVSPALPAGLSLDTATGVISGTATSSSSETHTVVARAGAWSASAPVKVSIAVADGPYSGWSGHKYVIANTQATSGGAGVTATVTRFPMLVRLGAADAAIFAASQKNGADIRFTKNDNTTRLKHEIDTWDSAGRTAAIWVLVDSVKGAVNNNAFRMHWGKADVADSSGGVFDSARYAAVFHLGGDRTTARPNAVPGANPATPANLQAGYTASNGVIGMADSLGVTGTGANGSHLSFGPMPVGTVKDGEVSYSAWIKKNPFTGWRHAISIGSGSPGDNFWFGHPGDEAGALRVRTAEGATEQTPVNAPGFWTDNAWQLVHVTFDGSVVNIYGNGVQAGNGDIGHTLPDVARTSAYIGRALWNPDDKFLGVFDEVRVVKSAVSPAWAKLEYENQKPNASMTFLSDTIPPFKPVGLADAARWNGPALTVRPNGAGLMFRIQTPEPANARVEVIGIRGNIVWSRTLRAESGRNQFAWDGRTRNGQRNGSGVYVVRMLLLDAEDRPTQTLQRRIPLTR